MPRAYRSKVSDWLTVERSHWVNIAIWKIVLFPSFNLLIRFLIRINKTTRVILILQHAFDNSTFFSFLKKVWGGGVWRRAQPVFPSFLAPDEGKWKRPCRGRKAVEKRASPILSTQFTLSCNVALSQNSQKNTYSLSCDSF